MFIKNLSQHTLSFCWEKDAKEVCVIYYLKVVVLFMVTQSSMKLQNIPARLDLRYRQMFYLCIGDQRAAYSGFYTAKKELCLQSGILFSQSVLQL